MKIVHVIASMGMGGAETLLGQLAGRQAAEGHDVAIVVLLDKQEVSVPETVPMIAIGAGARSWVGYLAAVWRLGRTLRALRADVVHAHMLHSNLLTRVLRLLIGWPVLINTVHAVHETDNVTYRCAYRLLDRMVDATVFVSGEAMERYRRDGLVSVARSTVVHNGVDLQRFNANAADRAATRLKFGFAESDIVLTAIGRLTTYKDYPNLLTAFDRVVAVQPRACLLVVGEGELGATLRADAQTRLAAERIHFVGLRTDIPEILSASDMLVLASTHEGFGLVLAEAMACLVPVVSTDSGGAAEVVGRCGRLVTIGDSEELASAMLDTIGLSPEERQQLVESGRERVCTKFSIDQTVSNWYQIYRRFE